jgi:hypothetical protein
VETSTPNTSIEPDCSGSSEMSSRIVVVLPAPLGPSSPKHSPGSTSRVSRSTAARSPNRWLTSSMSTAGLPGALDFTS